MLMLSNLNFVCREATNLLYVPGRIDCATNRCCRQKNWRAGEPLVELCRLWELNEQDL